MKVRPRVIPVLLVDAGRLVKTRRFRAPSYVGDLMNAVRIFNEMEVDELMVLDISASRHNRAPDLALLESAASEAFMPVAYGGGIRDVDTVARIFELGIEKVAINAGARSDLSLVHRVGERFGSQSIVASVDVARSRARRRQRVYAHESRRTGSTFAPLQWSQHLVDAGAGELMITSVDREGTGEGLDLDLLTEISGSVRVPVIGHGGIGSVAQIIEGLRAGASAIAVGSLFVYRGRHRAVLISYLSDEDRRRVAEAMEVQS